MNWEHLEREAMSASGANADRLQDFVCRQIDRASVEPDIKANLLGFTVPRWGLLSQR
jgi:hypothetical protein